METINFNIVCVDSRDSTVAHSSSHEPEDPCPDAPALVLQRAVHRHREHHRDQRLHQQRREVARRRYGVLKAKNTVDFHCLNTANPT